MLTARILRGLGIKLGGVSGLMKRGIGTLSNTSPSDLKATSPAQVPAKKSSVRISSVEDHMRAYVKSIEEMRIDEKGRMAEYNAFKRGQTSNLADDDSVSTGEKHTHYGH